MEERREVIEQASTYLVNLRYGDLLFFSILMSWVLHGPNHAMENTW